MKYKTTPLYQKGGKISDNDLIDQVKKKGFNSLSKEDLARAKLLVNIQSKPKADLTGAFDNSYDVYEPTKDDLAKLEQDTKVAQELQRQKEVRRVGEQTLSKPYTPYQAGVLNRAETVFDTGVETLNMPAAGMAELIASGEPERSQLINNKYVTVPNSSNFRNAIPKIIGGTGNQRSVSEVVGVTNPILATGLNFISDPSTWIGAGVLAHANKVANTNKYANEVLDAFKERIKTPEGIRRLNNLGYDNDTWLQNMKSQVNNNIVAHYDSNNNVIALNKLFNKSPKYSRPIARHEIEHGVQQGVGGHPTEIDFNLWNLDLTPKGYNSILKEEGVKSIDDVYPHISDRNNAIDYFNTGTGGREKSAFLAEVQQYMVDNKYINHPYDEITPELVKKVHADASNDKSYPLRLMNITEPTDKNFKIISSSLNKMLAPTGAIGTAAYNQDRTPKYQIGGPLLSGIVPSTLNYYAQNYPVTTQYGSKPFKDIKDIEGLYGFEQAKKNVLNYTSSPEYRARLQNEIDKSNYGEGVVKPTVDELQQDRLAMLNTIPTKHYRDANYYSKQPSSVNLDNEVWEDPGQSIGQAIVTSPGYSIDENKNKTYYPQTGAVAYNPKFARDNSGKYIDQLGYTIPASDKFGKMVGNEEFAHITQSSTQYNSPLDYSFGVNRLGTNVTEKRNITPYAHQVVKNIGYQGNWDPQLESEKEYLSRPHEVDAKIKAGKVQLLDEGVMKPGDKFSKKQYNWMLNNPNLVNDHLLKYMTGKDKPHIELKKNPKLKKEVFNKFKMLHNELADTGENDIPIARNGMKVPRIIKPSNISKPMGRPRTNYYKGNLMQDGGSLEQNLNLIDPSGNLNSYIQKPEIRTSRSKRSEVIPNIDSYKLTPEEEYDIQHTKDMWKERDDINRSNDKFLEKYKGRIIKDEYQQGGRLKMPILDTQIQNTTQPSFNYNGLKNDGFKYQIGGNIPMYSVDSSGKLNLDKAKEFRATDVKTPVKVKSIDITGAFDNDYNTQGSNVTFDDTIRKELDYIESIKRPESKSYGAQLTDALGNIVKQVGIAALQIPQIPSSIVAESAAVIQGDNYNYKNVLPDVLGGNQRQLDNVLGIENPYLGFGVNFVSDPSNWNPLKSAVNLSHSLKHIPKQSFIDLSKDASIIAANKAKYAERFVPITKLDVDRNKIMKILGNSAVLNEIEGKVKEYQVGGNVASNEHEMSQGLNAGINQFNFPTKGLKKMTMTPESGNITDPVIMEGYADGSLTDRKIAQPGQSNININADTIIEKPDLTYIDDFNEAYDHADRKKYPIFVWKNGEYPLKQHRKNK